MAKKKLGTAKKEIIESFESPDSSSVLGAHYDYQQRQLVVNLKNGPYAYEGIEPGLWRDFEQAVSKGQFFTAYIRPLYSGRKLG